MKSIKRIEVRASRVAIAADSGALGRVFTTSRCVAPVAAALLADEDQEAFLVFMLDCRNRVLGYSEVARGGVNACSVHLREAFRAACIQGAAAVIVAHNHPSGDPSPSDDDIAFTRKLVAAGELLGIPVLDHIVIGQATAGQWQSESMLDAGLLRA